MTNPSFAAHWKAINDRHDWDLAERQIRHMVENPVDWKLSPDGATESAWSQYLIFRLWAHGRTSDLARYCLEVAHSQGAEAAKVNAFEQTGLPDAFPRNRFRFLNAKVFIDGVFDRTPLDRSTVLQIAQDEAAIAPTWGPRGWDGYPQSDYLHTIDLLLLVDARDEAQAMIENARGMRGLHIKELFANAKLIIKSKSPVRDTAEAKAQYRRMFDLLRDPNYPDGNRGHPAFLPQLLIMACMWQKFYEPGDGAYDYDRAIDLLWE